MIYLFELIFSMNEKEGVGAFSYGIGKKAQFPCGKTTVANFLCIPADTKVKAFDSPEDNIFSNG